MTILHLQTSQWHPATVCPGFHPRWGWRACDNGTYLPTLGDPDLDTLRGLIQRFLDQPADEWNPSVDTYWAGKRYGRAAELAAIARDIGMTAEADRLLAWLKAELEDWFTATTDGRMDEVKYFVYDETWHTLLGAEESF